MQDSCDTLSNNNLTKATLIDYANYERLITFCTNFCWPFVSAYIYTSYCCISLHPFANALRHTTKPVYNLYSKGLSEHVETIYNHCEVKYVLSSIQFIRKMVNWLCFIIKSFYSFLYSWKARWVLEGAGWLADEGCRRKQRRKVGIDVSGVLLVDLEQRQGFLR